MGATPTASIFSSPNSPPTLERTRRTSDTRTVRRGATDTPASPVLRRMATGLAAPMCGRLAGPLAYSVQTIVTPHNGGIATAGPAVTDAGLPQKPPPGAPAGVPGGVPGMGKTAVTEQVSRMLLADADSYTWVAAVNGANDAAAYQLATDKPVMPIGGFVSSDPSPTLQQFQTYVSEHRIRYYIESMMKRPGALGDSADGGQSTEADKIAAWVKQTFTPTTVDGVTVYDLTTR
jgi:hypothetical protein